MADGHQTSLATLIDAVQQLRDSHADNTKVLTDLTQLIHQQQTTLSEISQRLTQIEQSPLLPTIIIHTIISSTPHQTAPLLRPIRCDLNSFDGSNPLDWIFQAGHYFSFQNTPDGAVKVLQFDYTEIIKE